MLQVGSSVFTVLLLYRTVIAGSLVPAQRQVFADLCSCSDNSVLLMNGGYFEKRSPLDLH
jgi:hypothetical protein